MDLGLSGKTALITGAGGGIGGALAEVFAAEGANLALHARSNLRALEESIRRRGWAGRALALPGDVTRPGEMDDLAARAVARFGRIDVAIANAGIWPPEDQRLDQQPEERIRRTIDVDLLGAIWTARAFFRVLARTGPRPDGDGACLVFIGSTAGRFGERGHADYSAAKAALYGLVRSLKNEIVDLDSYGRVNMIEPGWTVTEMARESLAAPEAIQEVLRTTALRQLARPVDIARAAALLASPNASRHISGEILTIAGGMEGRVQWRPEEIDAEAVRRRLE